MKSRLAVGALLVSMALVSQGWAVELLPGLRSLKGGPCCDPCGAVVKCAVPEPKACEPAGEACDACCKPKHDLLAGLKDLFKKKCCDVSAEPCQACAPVKCVVPEPAVCDPCCERPLKKLLGKKCACEPCEGEKSEGKACEPKAAEPTCEPPCCKCRPQLVLKMLHQLFGKKSCCQVEEVCDVCGAASPAPSASPTPAPKAAEPAPLPKAPKPDAEAQLNPPRSISSISRHMARY